MKSFCPSCFGVSTIVQLAFHVLNAKTGNLPSSTPSISASRGHMQYAKHGRFPCRYPTRFARRSRWHDPEGATEGRVDAATVRCRNSQPAVVATEWKGEATRGSTKQYTVTDFQRRPVAQSGRRGVWPQRTWFCVMLASSGCGWLVNQRCRRAWHAGETGMQL